ncbi:MAG: phage tail length tape measure family protein [Rhodanobacter sp.]
MAVQDYELLLRVRADLMEAMGGLTGLTDKLGEGDSAAQKLGESADEASERIRNMVQASQDQAKAQQQANASIRQTADQVASIGRSFDQQKVAAARSSEAITAEAATFNAAVAAKVRAMGLLNAAFAGNIAGTEGAAVAEVALDEAMATGAITSREQAAYIEKLTAAKVVDTVATEANTAAMVINGGVQRELGVMAGELARGNYTRLEGSMITLANRTGLLTALFNPLTLMIGAVVASVGVLAVGVEKGATQINSFNKALVTSGTYAGVTASQLDAMATRIGASSGRYASAARAMEQIAASGKIAGDALQDAGQAALNMSLLTGQSIDECVRKIEALADDPVKAVSELNQQFHFLTASTYDQITALAEHNQTLAAAELAQRAFAEASQDRLDELQKRLGWFDKFADKWSRGVNNMWGAIKSVGKSDNADDYNAKVEQYSKDLADYQAKVAQAKANGSNSVPAALFGSNSLDWFVTHVGGELQNRYSDLMKERTSLAKEASEAELKGLDDQATQKYITADKGLENYTLSLDKNAKKLKERNDIIAMFVDLQNKESPDHHNTKLDGVSFVDGVPQGGLADKLFADLNKRYDTKGLKPKSDEAAINAQQQLIKLLNDVQGALDPVTKAWATYNDKVQQATALADKAKTAKGANVQAINAERDAVVQLAAQVRDNTLAQEAEKDRAAFEKLRASLTKLDDTKLDKVAGQIKQLRGYLDRGMISQGEYDQTAGDIVQNSLTKLPTYKGISGAVGGPFGELNKVNNQQSELEKTYKTDLDLLNQYHDKRLITDQQFAEAENKLYQQHNDTLQQIDADRNRVMMMGITQSLSQGAEAIKEGFGEQSNAYRAAFAMSKAAAIAQASVNMYLDISQASAKGWPYNIPLIAQAMGEGLSIIGAIRSISAGYSGGGYTGSGGVHEPAGVVHKGEVVWSQHDVARAGGVSTVEAMRLGRRGYADGGYVGLANGFNATTDRMPAPAANSGSSGSNNSSAGLRIVNVVSPEHMNDWANSAQGEQVIMNIVGRNRTTLKAYVGR